MDVVTRPPAPTPGLPTINVTPGPAPRYVPGVKASTLIDGEAVMRTPGLFRVSTPVALTLNGSEMFL